MKCNQFLTVACAQLAVVVLWFASVIIHLERYRYANQVGLCYKPDVNYIVDANAYVEREKCLQNATPRTSRLWDLYHALINP